MAWAYAAISAEQNEEVIELGKSAHKAPTTAKPSQETMAPDAEY